MHATLTSVHTLDNTRLELAVMRRSARRTARKQKVAADSAAVVRDAARRTVADAIADLANEHRDGGTFSVADLLAECGEPAEEHKSVAAELLARAHRAGAIILTGETVFVADAEEFIGLAYRGL
jgi:hypothetical protein